MAGKLMDHADDTKLAECANLVSRLLKGGAYPIVWCRYIATAEYLAEGLQKALARAHPNVRVVAITGRMVDEERRAKVDELAREGRRVLVATDCLSEGVNSKTRSTPSCITTSHGTRTDWNNARDESTGSARESRPSRPFATSARQRR